MNLHEGCEPRCRGCAHRHLDAAASAAQKQGWLARALAPWVERLAELQAPLEHERWHYRDKVCLATAWDGARWQFGLRVRDEVLPIPACPVHSERVNAAIALLAPVLPPADVFPLHYHVQSGAQLTLVLKSRTTPPLGWLTPAVREALQAIGIEGVWLHWHGGVGRRVFAKNTWQLVFGEPTSRDDDGLRYGPAAFQQLIPRLHHLALDEAEAWLAPKAGDAVVDLYCGVGSTLRRWQARSADCVGVELGGEALACAAHNAPGATLLRGTCETRLPQLRVWAAAHGNGDSFVYANPPRTGMESPVLAWIANELRPRRLAYLSCSAGTLRRDLSALESAGFKVVRLSPYDFFPQTYHVETLALLERIVVKA
jgi:tRNA/tmRNA/rRNA uracil-C5-methylase (TrmA/RlmC/RlmD family)